MPPTAKTNRNLVDDILSSSATPLEVMRGLTGQAPNQTKVIGSTVDLGQLVKALRKQRGLSQQEFADLAGVGRRFLSELENGKPTLEFEKVVSVANAAGIDLLALPR